MIATKDHFKHFTGFCRLQLKYRQLIICLISPNCFFYHDNYTSCSTCMNVKFHKWSDACELVQAADSSWSNRVSHLTLHNHLSYTPTLLGGLFKQIPSTHLLVSLRGGFQVFAHHSHHIYVIISGGMIKSEPTRQTPTCCTVFVNMGYTNKIWLIDWLIFKLTDWTTFPNFQCLFYFNKCPGLCVEWNGFYPAGFKQHCIVL